MDNRVMQDTTRGRDIGEIPVKNPKQHIYDNPATGDKAVTLHFDSEEHMQEWLKWYVATHSPSQYIVKEAQELTAAIRRIVKVANSSS